MRRLRALDRLDARGSDPVRPRRQRRAGDTLRGLVVVSVALAVLVAVFWRVGLSPGGLSTWTSDAGASGSGGATGAGSGGAGSFRFVAHQPGSPDRPVTYDRCRTLHVLLNPAGGPDLAGGLDAVVAEAVAAVRRATGLRFVLDGHTTARPEDRAAGDPLGGVVGGRDPRVLVAFATPAEVPGLRGAVAGLGGSTRVGVPGGVSHYVGGQVTLDSGAFAEIADRPDGRDEARAIVMHELGHVVGLDHVRDPGELMDAENLGRTTYGPGDLRGLAALGRGPCRS